MRILHRSTGASHPCPGSKTRPLRLHTGRGRHLLIAGGISLRGQNRLRVHRGLNFSPLFFLQNRLQNQMNPIPKI